MNKILDSNIDNSLLDWVPTNRKISFFSTVSLNIQSLQNILLNDVKSKLAARKALTKYGLILDDFNDVLSGDIGMVTFENENSSKSSVLVILSIKDKNKLDYLLKVGKEMKYLEEEENNIYILPQPVIPFYPIYVTYKDDKLRLLIKNNKMFICGDKSIIDNLNSQINSEKNNVIEVNNKLKNSIFSVYGTNKISKIKDYAQKFNIETFKIQYNDSLRIQLFSNNKKNSSLKQVLSIK